MIHRIYNYPMLTRNEIFEQMAKCKTQKRAIQLAAEFVMLIVRESSSRTFRISTLMNKFGDAIEDVFQKE